MHVCVCVSLCVPDDLTVTRTHMQTAYIQNNCIYRCLEKLSQPLQSEGKWSDVDQVCNLIVDQPRGPVLCVSYNISVSRPCLLYNYIMHTHTQSRPDTWSGVSFLSSFVYSSGVTQICFTDNKGGTSYFWFIGLPYITLSESRLRSLCKRPISLNLFLFKVIWAVA